MIITINGKTIGTDMVRNGYLLEPNVEGLELPQIRTSNQNYSGRDGGRVNAQYYAPRVITLNGSIRSDGSTSYETLRKDLQNALPIRQSLQLEIDTCADNKYYIDGYVIDFKSRFDSAVFGKFQITFMCNTHYFLSETLNTTTINRYTGDGGFILPVILPFVFGTGTGTYTVTNNGTEVVYPTIRFIGMADTPKLTKLNTGEFIEFNINMSPTDELVVDMLNRTAILNGSSILSLRTLDSSWFGLEVGDNLFRYDTDNGSDTGYVEMEWHDAILTI